MPLMVKKLLVMLIHAAYGLQSYLTMRMAKMLIDHLTMSAICRQSAMEQQWTRLEVTKETVAGDLMDLEWTDRQMIRGMELCPGKSQVMRQMMNWPLM